MFKKMNKTILSSLASLITLVAFTGVGTNSVWILYEPDIPESLEKGMM